MEQISTDCKHSLQYKSSPRCLRLSDHIRLGLVALLVLTFLIARPNVTHAFANRVCGTNSVPGYFCPEGGPAHEQITRSALPFIKDDVLEGELTGDTPSQNDVGIVDQHEIVDVSNFEDANYHFDDCYFEQSTNTINGLYNKLILALNPDSPNLTEAQKLFGRLLHPIQDFYSHSNWVELDSPGLIDDGNSLWSVLQPFSLHKGVVVVQGEERSFPAPIVPSGITLTRTNKVVTVTVSSSTSGLPIGTYKGLVSGSTLINDQCPDSISLNHDDLNKDNATRDGFATAQKFATIQTQHEWCRLLNLVEEKYPGKGKQFLIVNWVKDVAGSLAVCKLKIAVTQPDYDDIGSVLLRPELSYPFIVIEENDLGNSNFLRLFDAVFINCSSANIESPQINANLRKYVQSGGSIYASDWAYVYIEGAFPGYVTFADPANQGDPQTIDAEINDTGLSSYISPTNPVAIVPLNYDLGGWVPIQSVAASTIVHASGDVVSLTPQNATARYYANHAAGISGLDVPSSTSSTDAVRPLVVSFRPYGETGGKVLYTTFHNEAQQTDLEKKLLEYLVLIPVTNNITDSATETIESEGLVVTKLTLGTINPNATSTTEQIAVQSGNIDKRLVFSLSWPGSRLKLTVFAPDGSKYNEIESGTSPIKMVIPDAALGQWKYQVTGVDVPFANYPYALAVGLTRSKVYLPMVGR